MNAVERLLAHGEQLLSLFDEMYQEPGSAIASNLDRSYRSLNELRNSFDELREQLPPASSYSLRWASLYWWQAALQIAFDEAAWDFSVDRASVIFRDRLAQRQQLLDRNTWQQMVADVVRDCRAWDFLAKKVVGLAQEVADSAIFIEEEMRPDSGRRDWQLMRYRLHHNLGLLRRIAQPPAPAGSTSEEQTNSNRSRVGRPPNDEALARDLLAGWDAFKPDEGVKKTKGRYLAQRPDVRALKTEDARQRKIAFLRVALDSAIHLRAYKKRQLEKSRG